MFNPGVTKRGIHDTMYRMIGYIEKDPETGLYVGIVPGIPGAHTQAETLDELQKNLKEVVELCLEEMDEDAKEHIPEFVGIQQLEVAG
jgi:predicted RNase H-like HicB family nuclease